MIVMQKVSLQVGIFSYHNAATESIWPQTAAFSDPVKLRPSLAGDGLAAWEKPIRRTA
jgi:hypothetical protein